MEEIGDDDEVSFFVEFINTAGKFADVSRVLEAILHEVEEYVPAEIQTSERFQTGRELYNLGISELGAVMELLESHGFKDNITADMLIVRGLDYYTGTVFETILPEYREIGSVCSGGRYENLVEHYSDQKFEGVGGSIGLTRLFYILLANRLLPEVSELVDYAIIPMSENERAVAFRLADDLKNDHKTVDVILTDKKLGDKLSHAAKIARFGIVLGEREVAEGKVNIKNFADGSETELAL